LFDDQRTMRHAANHNDTAWNLNHRQDTQHRFLKK